ncbi:MAG: NAD(P)H-hydrate dehydratase [archaeon]|nr:NAD(P)H-hydrate dehydratase [archaeon]
MDPIDMMVTDLNCEELGLSRLCLMESAGKSLAEEVGKIAVFAFSKPIKIVIFTGSGGNGGDGFVAARYLLNRGYEVNICMLSDNFKSEMAKTNYEILLNMEPRISRLTIHNLETIEDVNNCDVAQSESFSEFIIVDAILGTGIKGKLKDKVKRAIEVINNSEGLTISVDVPSGLDPLTGEINDIAVDSVYTISFHKVKTGVRAAGEDVVGGLVISDIGIPIEAELFVGAGDLLRLEKRQDTSHKGNNGKILIVGGSNEYSGAPAIAGRAAIGAGSDLVYVAAPEPAASAIKASSPDLIVTSLEGDYLGLNHLNTILELAENVDAILLGPGSSLNEDTRKLFNILASKIKKPLVLDADALKLVDLSLIKNREDIIITPHLFEFKKFFKHQEPLDMKFEGFKFNKIDENISQFQQLAKQIKGTTLLKGHYDLIMAGNKFKINKTGNAGMTVGGTGDALSGLATSLIAQELTAFDAASLACYLNGRAGDLAMEKQGFGFSSTDLAAYIGALMSNIIK